MDTRDHTMIPMGTVLNLETGKPETFYQDYDTAVIGGLRLDEDGIRAALDALTAILKGAGRYWAELAADEAEDAVQACVPLSCGACGGLLCADCATEGLEGVHVYSGRCGNGHPAPETPAPAGFPLVPAAQIADEAAAFARQATERGW